MNATTELERTANRLINSIYSRECDIAEMLGTAPEKNKPWVLPIHERTDWLEAIYPDMCLVPKANRILIMSEVGRRLQIP